MRRVVLRVREEAMEDVLDDLLPRLADGVHERAAAQGSVELVAHALTAPLPSLDELEALVGGALIAVEEGDVPDDWRERRRLEARGGVEVAGRIWLRSPLDPPAADGLIDVVVERGDAFGTGAHPTTRMCLELLTGLESGGGFADLGCGAGAVAIVAAKLGFAPVHAVDHDEPSVAAARENARTAGIEVDARVVDLLTVAPPPARVVVANVPDQVHMRVAELLPPECDVVIASGIRPDAREEVRAFYAPRGMTPRDELEEDGWLALRLERGNG
jgi:ribosomal protein L11 methyltransferase